MGVVPPSDAFLQPVHGYCCTASSIDAPSEMHINADTKLGQSATKQQWVAFTGKIEKLTISVEPSKLTPEDKKDGSASEGGRSSMVSVPMIKERAPARTYVAVRYMLAAIRGP
jgi:hypothetical protein